MSLLQRYAPCAAISKVEELPSPRRCRKGRVDERGDPACFKGMLARGDRQSDISAFFVGSLQLVAKLINLED
jgi:hypothetical protein